VQPGSEIRARRMPLWPATANSSSAQSSKPRPVIGSDCGVPNGVPRSKKQTGRTGSAMVATTTMFRGAGPIVLAEPLVCNFVTRVHDFLGACGKLG
jgi:hypothetical protein